MTLTPETAIFLDRIMGSSIDALLVAGVKPETVRTYVDLLLDDPAFLAFAMRQPTP